MTGLLTFGDGERLTGYQKSLMKKQIFELAKGYNRALSPDWKAPTFGRVQSELRAVENAANLLSAALKGLHTISVRWLTGNLPELTMSPPHWRDLPAARTDGGYISPLDGLGPSELHDDEKFARAFRQAFGLQMLLLNDALPERVERLKQERGEALARKRAATSDDLRDAAIEDYPEGENVFRQRRDMTDPLAAQMEKLAYVAKEARKKFEAGFGQRNRGRGDPLALAPAKVRLAYECFEVIRLFFGPSGVDLITMTPAGNFGTFVKDVANYASGHKEMGDFELDTAIDKAVLWGRADIEKRLQAGVDPFAEYHLDKER